MPAGAIDPVTVADDGGLTLLIQAGEFLCVHPARPHAEARPGRKLEPNEDGSVWTFKLRAGVKFQNGEHAEGRRRRRHHRPPGRPEERLQRAVGLQGHAVQGQHQEGRRPTRSNSISTRRTATSPTSCPRTTTTPSSCRRATRATTRRTSTAPGPSSSRNSRRRSAPPSCATTTIGARRRCPDRTEFTFYADAAARRSWRSRAARSTSSTRCRCQAARRCSTTPTSRSSA